MSEALFFGDAPPTSDRDTSGFSQSDIWKQGHVTKEMVTLLFRGNRRDEPYSPLEDGGHL